MISSTSVVSCNRSSANLLAFTSLTSHLIDEKRRLKPGDEVITVASAFPTTVYPILQCNAKPVFVDVDLPTYSWEMWSAFDELVKK